jgi:hypothetical protein
MNYTHEVVLKGKRFGALLTAVGEHGFKIQYDLGEFDTVQEIKSFVEELIELHNLDIEDMKHGTYVSRVEQAIDTRK